MEHVVLSVPPLEGSVLLGAGPGRWLENVAGIRPLVVQRPPHLASEETEAERIVTAAHSAPTRQAQSCTCTNQLTAHSHSVRNYYLVFPNEETGPEGQGLVATRWVVESGSGPLAPVPVLLATNLGGFSATNRGDRAQRLVIAEPGDARASLLVPPRSPQPAARPKCLLPGRVLVQEKRTPAGAAERRGRVVLFPPAFRLRA